MARRVRNFTGFLMTRREASQPGLHVCTRCDEEKPPNAFHVHPLGRFGIDSWCKSCKSKASRERRKNPEKLNREYWRTIQLRYGLTQAAFNELLLSQGNVCAICKGDPNGWKHPNRERRFHIDHDHETGVVRGLICWSCNAALGLMDDNPEFFQAAIDYLKATQAKEESA